MAATSARSWVRVRVSAGPWRARAAAVVRSQIPAAVSAGRYAENQAIPSESGRNSTRRSLALLVWRFSMLSGWWRSRHVRTFERNRYGTRSPAGQPRAGLGASGSRKCASSAAAPAGSRFAVSSTMARAWAQEIVPALNAARVSGKRFVRARQSPRNAPAVPAPTVRTQATCGDRHLLALRRPAGPPPVPPSRRWPAHRPRPPAPSTQQTAPPPGPCRPSRPGRHPPKPATDHPPTGRPRTGQSDQKRTEQSDQQRTDQRGQRRPRRRNPAPQSTPQQPPAPPCPPHSSPCFP